MISDYILRIASKKAKKWFLFTMGLLLLQLILFIYLIPKQISPNENKVINAKRNNEALFSLLLAAQQKLPPAKFEKFIQQLDSSNLKLVNSKVHLFVSTDPKVIIRYYASEPMAEIINKINHNIYGYNFSYQLPDGKWLNYTISVNLPYYRLLIVLITFEGFLLLLFLLYLWSVNRFAIPLRRFKKSAEQLGVDVNSSPVHVLGPSVVRETASALNSMQVRIQSLIENRTKMLAEISHDLRTPITRVKLRLQAVNNQEIATKISHDLDEMEAMIKSVLQFVEQDSLQEQKKNIDLNSLLAAICDDFYAMGHKVNYHEPKEEQIIFYGRYLALKRSFTNLINNASKFAQHIDVRLEKHKQQLIITILDDGPGIEENHLKQVKKPFYKVHNKQRSSIGVGLGLTIADEVITNHDGILKLANIKPHGLCVTIYLPIEEDV